MNRLRRLTAGAGVVLVGCGGDPSAPGAPVIPQSPTVDSLPLRTLAERRGFRIGTAVDRGFRLSGTDGTRFMGVVAREFNVLTLENDMKHERIHPARTTYRYVSADSLVRAYRKETERQKLLVKRANLSQRRLLFVVNAVRRLLDDEDFATLLRAEGLSTLPRPLAEPLCPCA